VTRAIGQRTVATISRDVDVDSIVVETLTLQSVNVHPEPPETAAECKAAMTLTSVALWRLDWLNLATQSPTNLGDQAGALVVATSPVLQKLVSGIVGVHFDGNGDTYAADILAPAGASFGGAVRCALVTDPSGAQHAIIGRATAGFRGWQFYFNDAGDLVYFFSDGVTPVTGTLVAAICPVGGEPFELVFAVDTSGADPVLRARWSRHGVNLGSANVVLTDLVAADLDTAAQTFGLGDFHAGFTDGSGAWVQFAAFAIGDQVEGATWCLEAARGLGFEPEAGDDVITMAIGDSITMGSDGAGGYRLPLAALEPTLRMVGTQTTGGGGHHEGVSGAHISDLRELVLPRVADQAPTTILLIAGTNDIILAAATVPDILTDLVLLAEQLLALPSVTRVLVGTIPPRDVGDPLKDETDAFNAGIAAAFAAASNGINVVDVCGGLTFSGPDEMADGVHPNTAGYADMAARWAAVLP
jgi:lysophospholipase L1-like esterase